MKIWPTERMDNEAGNFHERVCWRELQKEWIKEWIKERCKSQINFDALQGRAIRHQSSILYDHHLNHSSRKEPHCWARGRKDRWERGSFHLRKLGNVMGFCGCLKKNTNSRSLEKERAHVQTYTSCTCGTQDGTACPWLWLPNGQQWMRREQHSCER